MSDKRTAIIVAMITAAGALGAALIANVDKMTGGEAAPAEANQAVAAPDPAPADAAAEKTPAGAGPAAAAVPAKCRRQGTRIRVSERSEASVPIPPELRGCEAEVHAVARAFAPGRGSVWANVHTTSAAGRAAPACSSGADSGQGMIDAEVRCELRLPADATALVVRAGNSNAEARSLEAEVAW